jgi:hypothetical protein
MPKEKRRGNREIRKSKQEKVPPPKPESSFGKQIRATANAMPRTAGAGTGSRDASADRK